MFEKIKEKVKKKYKDYNENKAVENKVYKEAYRKEKLKVIKSKARKDAKSGGTIGKLKKFAKAVKKRNEQKRSNQPKREPVKFL